MGSHLALPKVTGVDVDLVRRRTLGGPGGNTVTGQVSIGRSEAVLLRPDSQGVDTDLADRLARDGTSMPTTSCYYEILDRDLRGVDLVRTWCR